MPEIQLSELEGLTQKERQLLFAAVYDLAASFVDVNPPTRRENESIESFLKRVKEFYDERRERDPRNL